MQQSLQVAGYIMRWQKKVCFSKKPAELNKYAVPGNSLLMQCVWACLLVLSGTFDQLTDMIIFVMFLFYGATALGVFILRKKMPDAPRPYKVWGYPVVPAIVIIIAAGLFVNTIITKPREAGFGLILMLTGVPMWYWFNRKEEVRSRESVVRIKSSLQFLFKIYNPQQDRE